MDERQGRLIGGKYELRRILGQGGAGQVYQAYDLRLGKNWTIKRVNRLCPGMEEQVLARVDKTLSPRIVDVVEEGNEKYLVMDWIDGENLQEHLRREGPYGVAETLQIGIALCDAIAWLHERQPPILYLDCKPSNIMMDREKKLWLVDFGSAVPQQDAKAVPIAASFGYAPPEQMQKDPKLRWADGRSDVYGIGKTLYALLSGEDPGQPPFAARRLCDCRPEVPEQLEKIVEKCIQDRPEDRYQTVGALKAALEEAEKGRTKRKLRAVLFSVFSWIFLALTIRQAGLFYGMLPVRAPQYGQAVWAFGKTAVCAALAGLFQRLSAARLTGRFSYETLQSVLRTEKSAQRWPLLLLAVFLAAGFLSPKAAPTAAAAEAVAGSPVILRDACMRKLLIKEGSLFSTGESLYLELSPERFCTQEELKINVTALGKESGRRYEYTLFYRPLQEDGGTESFASGRDQKSAQTETGPSKR